MKKMEVSKMENVTGGDWFLFGVCMGGCLAECQLYNCTNPVTDCTVGCVNTTL
jgi:surfactin synthase thioesterase subunit